MNLRLPDAGGKINEMFFGAAKSWPNMMLQMLMFFLALAIAFGLFFYMYKVIVVYKKKVIVLDTYNNKTKVDRVGIVNAGSNELLRFLYDRSVTLPNKIPTNVWIKYGPNKEEIFAAYFNNPKYEREVNKLIRKWYDPNRYFIGNYRPGKELRDEVNDMVKKKILTGVDNYAKNVINITWRESAKKYMTPSVFERYGPLIISGMMLVLLIFSWIVVTQQMTDAMGMQYESSKAIVSALERLGANTPPPP